MLSIIKNIVITPIEMIFGLIFCCLQSVPGIAIIAISLVMNLLALPLYQRADDIQNQENEKVNSMSKWTTHIKKTFSGDERYMMLTEYYRQVHYKPIYALRSVLSIALQVPFFIAAYDYLSNLTELKGASFWFIGDLGAPDALLNIGTLAINILPIVMTLLNIISAVIYLRGAPLSNKIQTYGLALFFLLLLYDSPAGLVFYWTMNQVFSIIKNVFNKLIKNTLAKGIILAAAGGIASALLMGSGFSTGRGKKILILLLFIFSCIPLASYLAKKNLPKKRGFNPELGPLYFIVSAVFISIFSGAVIPLATVYSDPSEFQGLSVSIRDLVLHNLCIYFGLFFFWGGVYYFLLGKKGKNVICIGAILFSFMIITDYLFFHGNYGLMSSDFVFDVQPVFLFSDKAINLLVIILLSVIAFFIIVKRPKVICVVLSILAISSAFLSTFYEISISKKVQGSNTIEDSNNSIVNSLVLSKNQKNVIVFVVDMAVGGYVPSIFEEIPELKDSYKGFEYYSNTLSYGTCTKWGAPGLYGGHEYAPMTLNLRSNEYLVDKHDEALAVMPTVFSENSFDTTIWNPVLAGYGDPEKANTVFKSFTQSFQMDSAFVEIEQDKYGKFNKQVKQDQLVYYSAFSIMPVLFRGFIYNGGYYYHTNPIKYTDEFIREYSYLKSLPEVTSAVDTDNNQFLMLYNSLPHHPALLDAASFEPTMSYCGLENYQSKSLSGIEFSNTTQLSFYSSNCATYIQLAQWLDYLKDFGVYDNSRIIIVSDHGTSTPQLLYNHVLEDDILEALNCTLLVKDFDSQAPFHISKEFHMNADVPSMAFSGIISNPVNPFTGHNITSNKYSFPISIRVSPDVTLDMKEKIFDVNRPDSVSLKFFGNDITNPDNWEVVQ